MSLTKSWILIIVVLLIVISFAVGWTSKEIQVKSREVKPYIPWPKELQEIVGVEPDGCIGPVTMAAWEVYCCNQWGIAVMEETYAKSKGESK